MRRFVEFCGADAPPDLCPITLHLDADVACGAYQPGVTTGAFGLGDMLRNEDPVSLTINDQAPGFAFVHTGLEPVGEGEA